MCKYSFILRTGLDFCQTASRSRNPDFSGVEQRPGKWLASVRSVVKILLEILTLMAALKSIFHLVLLPDTRKRKLCEKRFNVIFGCVKMERRVEVTQTDVMD